MRRTPRRPRSRLARLTDTQAEAPAAASGGFLPRKAPNDIGTTFFAGQGNGDINIAFPPASTYLQNGDGTTQIGVRLAVVPEPAPLAVATAAALAGFALWRRKRTAALGFSTSLLLEASPPKCWADRSAP